MSDFKPLHVCIITGLVLGTAGHWLTLVGRKLIEKGDKR